MMKMISWNVNGLRAAMGKGFMDFFRQQEADIFCLQETKLQEGQIQLDMPGYYQYWNYLKIIILLQYIRLTLRMNLPDCLTAWSGRMIFWHT